MWKMDKRAKKLPSVHVSPVIALAETGYLELEKRVGTFDDVNVSFRSSPRVEP